MSTKKTSYHVAIDGQGYMLHGAPDRPARSMGKAPIFGNRFASGDRSFADLSFWWFWSQTDWSGGIKDDRKWEDDAKFWYSFNVDVTAEPGTIRLANASTLKESFGASICAATNGKVGGTMKSFIAQVYAANPGKPTIKSSTDEDTWTSDISAGGWDSTLESIPFLLVRQGYIWAFMQSNGTTNLMNVCYSTGSSTWEDCGADISVPAAADIRGSLAACDIGGTLYVGWHNYVGATTAWGIVKTSVAAPTADTDWAAVKNVTNAADVVISMAEYDSNLYYLLYSDSSKSCQLRVYDIAGNTDTLVASFTDTVFDLTKFTNRYLHTLNGKLVITLPSNTDKHKIYEYDGNVLNQLWESKEKVADVYTTGESTDRVRMENLDYGALENSGKLYWQNLVYDGEFFYNNVLPYTDDTADVVIYALVNEGGDMFTAEDTGTGFTSFRLVDTTAYRSGIDTNYLVFSEVQELPTIPKLANSLVLGFEPLKADQSIYLYYLTTSNGQYVWQEIGSLQYAVDGGVVSQKEFRFSADDFFTKRLFKISLNSDGTNTPIVNEVSFKYLPVPDFKHTWNLSLNCTDEIKLLDNKTAEPKQGVELRNILRNSFYGKTVITFEDVDYAETTLSASTDSDDVTLTVVSTAAFAEKGRIKIGDEEIKYTGKTATTFTGCTRGYRGTQAVAHDSATAVSTKYTAIITEYEEQLPVASEYNPNEFIVRVSLMET